MVAGRRPVLSLPWILVLWIMWALRGAEATNLGKKNKLCGLVRHDPIAACASGAVPAALVAAAACVATGSAVAAAARRPVQCEGFACGPMARRPAGSDAQAASSSAAHASPSLDYSDSKGVKRALAPTVRPRGRASFEKARAALATAEARRRARRELESDFYAKTSAGPRAARLKLMTKLGRGAATPFEIIPVTKEVISDIAAALKAGGYRSADAYLALLKKEHLTAGHTWGEVLGSAMADATRSVRRGVGPPRHANDFEMSELAAISVGARATAGGPDGPRDVGVCMALWMLRGLEAASLLGCQAEVLEGRGLARLNLGPTKTDPAGRGALRTLRCACADAAAHESTPVDLCPVAALERILARRVEGGLGADDLLFAGRKGRATTALGVKETFSALLKREVTEHSFRRAGAKYYAVCGVSEAHIMFHGRWGSAAVRRYIGEALAGQTTDAVMHAAKAACNPAVPRSVANAPFSELAKILERVEAIAKKAVHAETGELLKKAAAVARETVLAHSSSAEARWLAAEEAKFGGVRPVGSGGRGLAHRVAIGGSSVPSELWTSACGWNFGRAPHVRTSIDAVSCKKCCEWAPCFGP